MVLYGNVQDDPALAYSHTWSPSRNLSLRAGTEMESSWVTSSVQTSSKISWKGDQLREQLAKDQFCGELDDKQAGKLVKVKPAQRTERSSWMRRDQLKDQRQTNQSGQAKQFEQSTKTNLIGSNCFALPCPHQAQANRARSDQRLQKC
ncbi:ethylene-insensitive protein 2-like [Dorcoceras hygrometricum]|uniref:Ethylene-insensitive protein 2-like n=1 Tax=Dorcoceras hygrometricum TaxID=472368 RepID=A0A2Z7CHR3_9LAMI|nr:ethylene-insensitive protein 2-like [Dorcoceras hygrometricum]